MTTSGASDGGVRDYLAWHEAYDDPDSNLSKRLRAVRTEINRFLDSTAPHGVRVLSVCAGDGRDLLGVLARRPDRARVSGTLVEVLPALVDRAREAIDDLGIGSVLDVRQSDAGHSGAYAGAVPADLLIVSGVMGNISVADIEGLVHTCRELCAPGATVVWTRGRMEPDLGPAIRSWFEAAGYASVALHEDIEGSPMRLGVERLTAPPLPLRTGRRIFTFLR